MRTASAAVEEKWRDRTRLWAVPLQDQEDLKYKRRILYKAEVTRHPNRDPKDNPRFVITNMKQSPQWLYEEVYCQRGDLEIA